MVESATRSALTAEIVERRSVVAFDSRPIEAEKLEALIQAARWAPSASNRQSWRVTLVRDGESRAALDAALSEGNQGWAPNAPLLVVFAVAAPDPERPGQLPKLMLDVGFAGQNMMLEAVHQGLRVHPMAGWNEDKVKAALDVPEENAVAFLLAVGYAGDVNDLPEAVRPKETRERVRNAVGENFFDGVFGEPWRG